MPEELGLDRGTWFSPDGRRLAYLQLDERGVGRFAGDEQGRGGGIRYPRAGTRNPRPRVGVVSVEGGPTQWIDLGDPPPEYVARVAWFPGGQHLAVVTLDRAQRTLRLLACGIDGAPPRILVEERDPAWVDVPPAPRFLDDGRFLWRSARDGDDRWYLAALPSSGVATLVPVTAPGIDVPDAPVLRAGTDTAVYVGTRRGALHARPYLGPTGEEAAFAPPAGYDTSAVIDPTGTWAVVTWSNATTPPRRALRRVSDGEVVRGFTAARAPP